MKILRFIPVIALAFLGIIAYALYKTGSFINKKVSTEATMSQDGNLQIGADTAKLSIGQPMSEALSDASNAVQTTVSTTKKAVKAEASKLTAKKETASIEPEKTQVTPKSAAAKTISSEKSDKAKTEPNKIISPKEAAKTAKSATEKAATSTTQTVAAPKETPKAASTVVKKENTDARFHVIIGTYASEANAKTKAVAFEQKNKKKASILKYGGYYRVSADDFEFGQAASQYALKLREGGEDSIILKF